jgi:CheY-like chemotaxis protein
MSTHPVMVVEDDSEIRDSLLEILSEAGYQSIGAGNGQEALGRLRALPTLPCLILLDLMMPVMDGVAFREKQLEDPTLAAIPVVVISAARDLAVTARALNAHQHMSKPLDLDVLLELTRRLCPGDAQS